MRFSPVDNALNMPPLVSIKLTEECKLLPSPGIYAVSVESGTIQAKGMTIIHRKPDNSSEVLLNIFGEIPGNESVLTISFHKKIHGAIALTDSRAFIKIKTAIEEISDLIY